MSLIVGSKSLGFSRVHSLICGMRDAFYTCMRYGHRPSYMTSGIRFCASLHIGMDSTGNGGRTIQVNFGTARELVQSLRGCGSRDIVLKIYAKGN